jgi:hypothetical protein
VAFVEKEYAVPFVIPDTVQFTAGSTGEQFPSDEAVLRMTRYLTFRPELALWPAAILTLSV